MSKCDFALQWLDYLNVSIYNKGNRVFTYDGKNPNYDISPLTTRIKLGQELGDEDDKENYTFMSWLDFDKMGFAIKVISVDYSTKWKRGQRVAYGIIRKHRNTFGLTYDAFKKSKTKIQHDAANRRFRLCGERVIADETLNPNSGVGEWVVYDADAPKDVVANKMKQLNKDEVIFKLQGGKSGSNNTEPEYQNIKEIAIGISDEKYIVCIPKHPHYCQRIIVVGQSGMGKSLVVNALSSRLLYSGDRVGWIIDPLNQFQDLSLPQDYNEFNKRNSWLGNEPKPIPAIQLYMGCRYSIKIAHPHISLTLTQNFEEFLQKYKFYTHGIGDYDVGKTIRYLPDLINGIKNATSGKEIQDRMYEIIPNMHKDKGMQAMGYKWKSTFDTIFKEKFTSNLYVDDMKETHELEVRYEDGKIIKGHPFIMCMEAGVVPVINVSAARRQKWLRNYLADLMQKIVAYQMSKEGKGQHRMWIIADEMNTIYEKGKRKDNASEAFEELYRQGRFNNIGFIGNTQSLDKLEKEMYKNANYIFCVYMQAAEDRKKLKDFQVDKEVYEQIGNLTAQELILFRNPEDKFITYDKWGRRKVIEGNDRRWFKVRLFPPVNHHKVPESKEE